MRILQKVTLLILRVIYVLLFGIRFRIQSLSYYFLYTCMYCYQLLYAV